MRQQSVPPPAEPGPADPARRGDLRRGVIGTGGLVFMVVAAAAPLTVMAGIAPLGIAIGGVGAPVGYLAAGVVLTIFAVAFTRMTRSVDGAGAFYAYIARGLGSGWGLAAAVLALMAYNSLQIGVYGLFAAQTQATLSDVFGLDVPWPVIAVVAVALVLLVGVLGLDIGAKVLGVLLVLETGILLVMAVGVLRSGGATGLDASSFTPAAVFTPGMGAVLAFGFAAYMGFESTVLYRREARNPDRTIPRATYIAVAFMAVFYALIVWSVIQALGSANAPEAAGADIPGLFFAVIERYVGPWASATMHILVISSVYASQLAFHNAITRYVHALSQDGVLPRWFGRVHMRTRAPYRAGIAQTALALVIIAIFAAFGADPYLQLLMWVNTPGVIAVLILQTLTAVATVVYFVRRNPSARTPAALIAGIVSSILLAVASAILVSNVALLTNAPTALNVLLVGLVPFTLIVGLLLAAWLRRSNPLVYARIGWSHDESAPDPTSPAPATPKEAV